MSEETLQQRAAIGARGKTIVSASAGSGKTRVMVQRIASLVADEGKDVRRILAVTFTNKAAAQMRERIRSSLLDRMATADEETRRILRDRIRALPTSDISTIHAFCGRLIRTYFYLLGIDPAFRIVGEDDAEGMSLSARALDRTFEDGYAEGDADFVSLLSVYFRKKNDGRLRKTVTSLLSAVRGQSDYREILQTIAEGGEDKFGEAVALISGEMKRLAENVLKKLGYLEEEMEEAPAKVKEFAASIRRANENILAAEDVFAMGMMSHGISRSPARSAKQAEEINLLITRLAVLADQTKKNIYQKIGEYHVRDEELARYEDARLRAASLAKLVLRYDDAFAEVKRDAGVLDYGDLEHFALRLLSMPEVLSSLREKYEYVFVDEYQDVNPMQEKILTAIGGGDVFLVGDEKQAIYGFRGSKSEYFRNKTEDYALSGNSLCLSANFRSAENILSAVNTVFSAVLGEDYTPMEGGAVYGGYRGEVLLHELAEEEEEPVGERGVYSVCAAEHAPSKNRLARKVAQIVEEECGRRQHLGRQVFDADMTVNEGGMSKKGGMRDVSYGDIAVLVRKNTKAAGAIVAALSERGIPVTASAEVNICDYFEVRLLTDWLELIDDPEQDIPMASAMLSALGGFSDGELAHIRLVAGQGGSFRAACALYRERAEDDPVVLKLARFYERLAHYRALARVRSAAEMIVLLLADGIEAQIAAKGDSANRLARVRRLIAESEGSGSVHAFLRRLSDCDYQVDFSETGGENAVHVLTMHASKGLEFPVVILTELDEEFRAPDHDDVMWTDDFHIAPRAVDPKRGVYCDTVLRRAAAISERRATLEGERNLLYVAMTRACSRLHMIFEKKDNADEEDERFSYDPGEARRLSDLIPKRQLLRFVAPAGEETREGETEAVAAAHQPDSEMICSILRAGAPYAHEESTVIPVKDSATGLMKKMGTMSATELLGFHTEEEDTMSEEKVELADMDASFDVQTGLAYHAFLEHIVFGKGAKEELGRMREEKILPGEQLALLNETRLDAILAMPCLRSLGGKRLMREQRFLVKFPAREFSEVYGGTAAEDGVIFQGALDLLVEEEKGKRYTLIDYKFSSHTDEEIRARYAVQIKLYKKTVARITGAPEEGVSARIVNIARCRAIPM